MKGWEREKIKIIVSFRSYPKCNRKFHKNNKKMKKYYYELISSQNRLEIDEKEGNKNYRSILFLPRCIIENSKKKKKNKKIQKIKKYQCGFIISQNRFERAGKERK